MSRISDVPKITAIGVYSNQSNKLLGMLRLRLIQDASQYRVFQKGEFPEESTTLPQFQWLESSEIPSAKATTIFENSLPTFLLDFQNGYKENSLLHLLTHMVANQSQHTTSLSLVPCEPWEKLENVLDEQLKKKSRLEVKTTDQTSHMPSSNQKAG